MDTHTTVMIQEMDPLQGQSSLQVVQEKLKGNNLTVGYLGENVKHYHDRKTETDVKKRRREGTGRGSFPAPSRGVSRLLPRSFAVSPLQPLVNSESTRHTLIPP